MISNTEDYFRMDGSNRNWKIAALVAFAMTMISTVAFPQNAASIESPAAAAFKSNCAVCHGVDGAGSALGNRLHTPDLRSKEVYKEKPLDLARTISAGKNNMPSFAAKLSSEQIQSLAEYVSQLHAQTTDPAPKSSKQ